MSILQFLSVDRECNPGPRSMPSSRPNLRSITLGARPPHRETQQSIYVKNRAKAINCFRVRRPWAPPAARAPDHRSLPSVNPRELPHCRGSSAPTTPLLLHLLSLVVGAPPIFFFPYVLQITFHDAPNTTINNITAGNRTNLSIDNNVHSGG